MIVRDKPEMEGLPSVSNRTTTPAPRRAAPLTALPAERLERVEAWGMNTASLSQVFRPTTVDGIREAYETARRSGRTVGLRGAGRSYGDASLNSENICLDLTRMTAFWAGTRKPESSKSNPESRYANSGSTPLRMDGGLLSFPARCLSRWAARRA